MEEFTKLKPIKAAQMVVNKYFPSCDGAILAGSVVRGQATETSDLDIIIFDREIPSSYRVSLIDFDWLIELFVHNLNSYKDFFESDYRRARPSLPRMVSEGLVLKDNGVLHSIKAEAKELLDKGPESWSSETITMKRYFITDALDDFIGCEKREEGIFIAQTLSDLVSEFVLRTNNKWVGASKWVMRSLKQYDDTFAERFVEAFDLYYRLNSKDDVVNLADAVLKPYGGRLFDGFSLGKN